jgi:hypothetical protein
LETEPQHFTPWLAQEENLERLGKTLQIELELEAQEINVGGFRADILCKNTEDNSWVLIERHIRWRNEEDSPWGRGRIGHFITQIYHQKRLTWLGFERHHLSEPC